MISPFSRQLYLLQCSLPPRALRLAVVDVTMVHVVDSARRLNCAPSPHIPRAKAPGVRPGANWRPLGAAPPALADVEIFLQAFSGAINGFAESADDHAVLRGSLRRSVGWCCFRFTANRFTSRARQGMLIWRFAQILNLLEKRSRK